MKYMLLIYHNEKFFGALNEVQRQDLYHEYRALREDLTSKGVFLDGSQLRPTTTASSVRVRDGKALTTDGPFAETKEQLGGYFLIEVETETQAHEIAARIPSANEGTIEVRGLA